MNTYNIYRNGKEAVKNVTPEMIEASTGLDRSNISRHMTPERQYKGKDGCKYYFKFYEYNVRHSRKPKVKAESKPHKKFRSITDTINDWNNDMMPAADLIRSGKGQIAGKYVNGKWKLYTEVKAERQAG